ncbi:hypothetical protein, partial [Polaribacter sp.]|uniref:hypothetical protein n=1 Tax=Polaribacter sp. TaxID=1920175 RepID=UPI0040477615
LVSANTDVVANTAKVGITAEQSDAISANTAKVGYTDELVSANTDVVANTAKVGITAEQSDAIEANTAKTSMVLGTTAETALAGDTPTITTVQSDAIAANTIAITETVKTTGDQSIDGAKTFTNETTYSGGIKLGNDNKIRWSSDDVYIAGTTAGDNLSFVLGGQERLNISQTSILAVGLPIVGNVTGSLTGNVTGNVTGSLTGNVTGDVTGNVTGDVTGNVTSNILQLNTLTQTEIDAITAEEGMVVYNQSKKKIQIYSTTSTSLSNSEFTGQFAPDDSYYRVNGEQTFIAPFTGTVYGISLYLKKRDDCCDTYLDFGGNFVYIDVGDNTYQNASSSSPFWYEFTFSNPVSVTFGQTYSFNVNSRIFDLGVNFAYSNGEFIFYTPNAFAGGVDLMFMLNYSVDPNTPVTLSWIDLN